MIFITGGAYQGKTEYAIENFNLAENEILDLAGYDNKMSLEFYFMMNMEGIKCVKNLHQMIRVAVEPSNLSAQGLTKEEMLEEIEVSIEDLSDKTPDMIFIMDEVGGGIVPIDKAERDYREAVGVVGCRLAKKAECVYQVVCGIGRVIKQ